MRYTPWLLCAFRAAHMALFPVAIVPLFVTEELSLSLPTFLTVQALFGFVVAAAEFPSGYVADRLGHRCALALGSAIAALGWTVYTVAQGLWGVVGAEVCLGLGMALISGADSALMYEALLHLGREAEFARFYGRMQSWGQLAEGTAAISVGVLYTLWVRLPFMLEILLCSAALLMALRMAAPAAETQHGQPHMARMMWVARETLSGRTPLRAVVFTSVAFGLSSFIPVWLIALYARRQGLSEGGIGVVWAAANYLVALGAMVSHRVERGLGLRRMMWLCVVLIALGYAGLSLGQGIWAVGFYGLITFMRGINGPVLHHLEQRLVTSTDRASFVSFRSLLFRGSFVFLGPLIGHGVEQQGDHRMFGILGAACSFAAMWAVVGLTRALASRPAFDGGTAE